MSSINKLSAPHSIPSIDHADGPKHKQTRSSLRLQEKCQVDSLLTVSQPDPTEALSYGPPTPIRYRSKKSCNNVFNVKSTVFTSLYKKL